jgi:hypothetical protein
MLAGQVLYYLSQASSPVFIFYYCYPNGCEVVALFLIYSVERLAALIMIFLLLPSLFLSSSNTY